MNCNNGATRAQKTLWPDRALQRNRDWNSSSLQKLVSRYIFAFDPEISNAPRAVKIRWCERNLERLRNLSFAWPASPIRRRIVVRVERFDADGTYLLGFQMLHLNRVGQARPGVPPASLPVELYFLCWREQALTLGRCLGIGDKLS